MSSRGKLSMKALLRDRILPRLAAASPYFNLRAIRAGLKSARCPFDVITLNGYLHELTEVQHIFDAGRGWYSSLAKPFVLNTAPVKPLVAELEKRFPLLEFSCWSTAQVAGYGHHLLAKFVSFVHTERDTMESVAEALRDSGWTVYLNPTQKEVTRNFRLTKKTVVIRPSISRAPTNGKYAAIEKIIVDLCVEAASLRLIDAAECQDLVANLAGKARVSAGSLAEYAKRRRMKLDLVIPVKTN